MIELPFGTVTLLFTDIEGSTRLLHDLGVRYAEVLAEHRRLLHAAFTAYGGQDIDTQGDAFFVAFAQATEAVAAAAAAQRALHDHPWPEGGAVRVRIGLHTGQPERTPGGYVGMDVHYAARLMAAGHGGQVLLSETTREAVGDTLPVGVSLRRLGQHRLKDMARPECIYQLVIAGLPGELPPLRTIDLRPNNLPAPVTELIGRAEEVATATELLRRSPVRLITFTGVGGTGKTRLSLQVAADVLGDFEDGVFFVELAPVSDLSFVVPAIASTVGVREVASQPLLDSLKEYLKDRQMLLVLDNFEQVVLAATVVAELLAACRKLKVLATSRIALHLRGEHELPVSPLAVPDLHHLPSLPALSQVAAVELFIQRAQAVQPSFAFDDENAVPIAAICTRLDGLPLAIELAAPRIRLLSPGAILTRLESRFKLLIGGAQDLPERHQTLRECIAWSYDLLEESERALFRRLAVFAGGCTAQAAQVIMISPDSRHADVLGGLTSLVDKNLLRQEGTDEEARFTMLETIREFGVKQLEATGTAALWRRQHMEFFLALVEKAEVELTGPSQSEWLRHLDQEQDNLRAALSWSLEVEPQMALRMSGVLWHFWEIRGQMAEGRRWLHEALSRNEAAPDALRARALSGAGKLAWYQGDYDHARLLLEESLTLHRALADEKSIAHDLSRLGLVAIHQGNLAQARALMEQSLSIRRRLQDKAGTLQLLLELQEVAFQSNPIGLRNLCEEALSLAHELSDRRGIAAALMNLGFVEYYAGHYEAARPLFEQSLEISRALGEKWYVTRTIYGLGKTLTLSGDLDQAYARLQQVLKLVTEQQFQWVVVIPYITAAFGYVAAARGQWEQAVQLFGTTQALCDAASVPLMPQCKAEYERHLSAARGTLEAAAFETAWLQGRAMSAEQALQSALTEADVLPQE